LLGISKSGFYKGIASKKKRVLKSRNTTSLKLESEITMVL